MKLQFDTDNAYYADYDFPNSQIARTLREVADRIETGNMEGSIRDGNGNVVGEFDVGVWLP